MYVVNYYDTKSGKANSDRVSAKTKEDAVILFCTGLSKSHANVGSFCFHDYEYAELWFKEWFPHWTGLNIVKE